MARLAAVLVALAFACLVGARFVRGDGWLVCLYLCVLFATTAAAIGAVVVLRRVTGGDWTVIAPAVAAALALAAFARSLWGPLGRVAGSSHAPIEQRIGAPASAAAALSALILAWPGLRAVAKASKGLAVLAWTLSGAALGSVPQSLGWRVGPRTVAVGMLFLAVLLASLPPGPKDR